MAEEKKLRVEETRKIQETLTETEQRAHSVEQRFEELKAKPAQWLTELQWINNEMASKFLLTFIPMSRPP